MIKQLQNAVKALLQTLRVRNKRPHVFNRTTEGERFARHYPSVSYNVYIEGINFEDYMYAYYQPDGVAEVSGMEAVQTRTFDSTGYTNTGYNSVTIIKARPYNVYVDIVTRAKTENDDTELTEGMLTTFGHEGQIVVSSSDNARTHGLDMYLDDMLDQTDLYRRLEDTQRLFERKFTYVVEGWLEESLATETTVQSRFYEEHMLESQVSTTGFYSVSSSFSETYSPDGS